LIFLIFLNGWYVSCFGTLIPYFTAVTGHDETDYAYLFMVRSLANVVGGLMSKYFIRTVKTSKLMVICIVLVALGIFAANLSLSTFNLTVTIFLASVSLIGTLVILYGVVIKLFLDSRPDYYIQLIGFFFGVGAMCGPLLVVFF
jgi:hypothetical protein